jgi:N-(2-amino-2-carboxyethyl)-L-glutamate synthase
MEALHPYSMCTPIGGTPIAEVVISVNGIKRLIKLKLESYNPCGSLKDRIAASLINHAANEIDREIGIIESTSGNLGVAMAAVCNQYGIRFNAVVDPRTSPVLIERMCRLGSKVTVIDEPDSCGGFLLSRIEYVHEQLRTCPGLVWTNQYESSANPDAHFVSTAPELWRQVPGPSTVLVPVSTGGTFSGLARFARNEHVAWRLIAVDVTGSAALGRATGQRLLSGIGSSRPSKFLNPAEVEAVHINAAEAISACLWLSEHAGVDVGGSSGAAVAAALRILRDDSEVEELVCICPDGGDRYLTTIYQASWREAHGVLEARVSDDVELLRVQYLALEAGAPYERTGPAHS